MAIKNVTVAGGGVLGSQIALQSAYCGMNVTIWGRSEESHERTKPKLERYAGIYKQTLEETKTNPAIRARGLSDEGATAEELDALIAKVDPALASIKFTTSYEEAAKDADLIIEAVVEDAAQKIAFYQAIAPFIPEHTLMVTNSSYIVPSTFAEYTGCPERYLAMHFANDIYRGNTAEIMPHPGTDMDNYNTVVDFARAIRMEPVCLYKEQFGYLLNSLLLPWFSAAENLWADDISDPQTIDKVWMLATGAPSGPFMILDTVSLPTIYAVLKTNPDAQDPTHEKYRLAQKLKEKIDKGETGVNAGKGFYDYTK